MAVVPLDGLTAALEGCAFRREAVAEMLDAFPVGELFGAIAKGKALETIFCVS